MPLPTLVSSESDSSADLGADSVTAGLAALKFENAAIRDLPVDPGDGHARRQVQNACLAFVEPTPTAAPQLVAYATEVAQLLDLTDEDCQSPAFTRVFSGNALLPGMQPYATCYGGHQFGNWAGQLGDGRAINLGDAKNRQGERFTLQLKGAGETPFSRTADGLAVLRSSVREFVCSEAMFHLGVPTTRALSLCLTGDEVMRDMLYDGNAANEPGAVVCRVAPSFVRFGHYQMLTARGETELLEKFFNHNAVNDFPELADTPAGPERVLAWFQQVSSRTALMVAHWMRVGFVHGVMNTDNMSVLGETIDYGPYGWLENYDPDWTPNTTDAGGKRYRFAHQPAVAQWNLLQLANALFPMVNEAAPLEEILAKFETTYVAHYQSMQAQKLGLTTYEASDAPLFEALEAVLPLAEIDMTLFYRSLASFDVRSPATDHSVDLTKILRGSLYDESSLAGDVHNAWNGWLHSYAARLREDNREPAERMAQMNAVNPLYVFRNYLAQLAIDAAAEGDFSRIQQQLEVLRKPYTEQPGREEFAAKRPEWARTRVGCSMLSCSS